MNCKPDYTRPTLGWIKRRARRLQSFYGIARRLAVFDAWRDYMSFAGTPVSPLTLISGGKK
ncbi:MAG: hypothetical protein KF796_19215 [Ramlibacter sp.]|nr:hypothetical protein [Ramlibacter sp.]